MEQLWKDTYDLETKGLLVCVSEVVSVGDNVCSNSRPRTIDLVDSWVILACM